LSKSIKHLILISIYSAISILVSLIEIPFSALIPLKLDLSDLVILVSLLTLNVYSALIVTVLRFILRYLIIALPSHGAVVGLFAESVALIASLILVLLVYVCIKIFKKDNLLNRNITCAISIILFTFLMVLLNYLFITPSFFSFYSGIYKIIFFKEFINNPSFNFFSGGNNKQYLYAIFITYAPFNIIKAFIVVSIPIYISPRIKQLITKEKEIEKI